jgi:hypothetical protein
MREPQSRPTDIMPAFLHTSCRRGRRPRIPSLSTISNNTSPKHQPQGHSPQPHLQSQIRPGPTNSVSRHPQTHPKGAALITPPTNQSQPDLSNPLLRIAQIAVNPAAGHRASAEGQDRYMKRPCPDWPQQFFHLDVQSKPNPRSSANICPGGSAAPASVRSSGATSAGRYRQP